MERDAVGQSPARRRGGLPPFYVAIWVVLSSISLTYLAMLSIRPDLAEGLGHQVAVVFGGDAGSLGSRHSSDERARAEIIELRRTLDSLSGDLEAMRRRVMAREEREQALVARLAAVEAQKGAEPAVPLSTASIDRPPSGPGTGDDDAPSRGTKGRIVERSEAEPPASTPDPPQRRERPRDDRIVIGPAQIKPPPEAAGPKGIQIATGPSVDALRISWMLLSERHKEVLRRYEPRFVPSTGGSGPAYRLIAGPIENTAAANRVCNELKARRVTCGVSAFGGEPL